ncbi:MAG: hypothetical protein DBW72_00365 [Flavobacteriales bacterium]|nr:MAG: hypothetical protein DBW72_00365 [Flavobacteriales bacterium]
MNNRSKRQLVWGIRVLVSALFVLSALAKLYPSPVMGIAAFETKYLGAIGIDGGFAKVVSRLLIGFEISLAILLLLPYYLKKIVLPTTISLLSIFSIHLLVQVVNGDASNCGCFGELIPMTPLEALIKNILTIGILILPLTIFKDFIDETRKINPLVVTGLSSSLLMFVLLPQSSAEITGSDVNNKESKYSKYFDDISKGNKLLCFFSPTCEHCMETGKQITALKNKYPGLIPEVRILFMDESDNGSVNEINSFFEFIGAKYNYKVLSIEDFVPIFWGNHDFPGVLYVYEGKERIFFDGTGDKEFDGNKLLNEIKREY